MADNPFGIGGSGEKGDSRFPTGGGFVTGESSSGHGRILSTASGPNPVINDDNMNATLHQLAMEAYKAMLRYFRARDGDIPWEGESFFTELRAELGLTSEEHGSIRQSFLTDETLLLIRSMRESLATPATSQLVDNRNPSTSGTGGLFRFFTPQPTNRANLPSIPAGTVVGADRNYRTSGGGTDLFGSHVSSGVRGYEHSPFPSFSTQPTHIVNQPTTSAGTVVGTDRNVSSGVRGYEHSPFPSFSTQPTHIANQPTTSAGTVVGTDRNVSSGGRGYEHSPFPSFSTQPTHIANQPTTSAGTVVGKDRNVSSGGRGYEHSPFPSFSTQPTHIANQPTTSAGTVVGTDRNYPTSGEGKGLFGSHVSSGGLGNEFVGRRVRINYFYVGVITGYNPREGTHSFTYDLASGRVAATINLALIPPDRIQWLSNEPQSENESESDDDEEEFSDDLSLTPDVIESELNEAESVLTDNNSTPVQIQNAVEQALYVLHPINKLTPEEREKACRIIAEYRRRERDERARKHRERERLERERIFREASL